MGRGGEKKDGGGSRGLQRSNCIVVSYGPDSRSRRSSAGERWGGGVVDCNGKENIM